jgi:hypothetical protein
MCAPRDCHDRMVVGFTTTYAISKVVSWNPAHGEVYSIQHYVISDLRWFSQSTPVSPTNKMVTSDVKHHYHNP